MCSREHRLRFPARICSRRKFGENLARIPGVQYCTSFDFPTQAYLRREVDRNCNRRVNVQHPTLRSGLGVPACACCTTTKSSQMTHRSMRRTRWCLFGCREPIDRVMFCCYSCCSRRKRFLVSFAKIISYSKTLSAEAMRQRAAISSLF